MVTVAYGGNKLMKSTNETIKQTSDSMKSLFHVCNIILSESSILRYLILPLYLTSKQKS